MAMTPNAQNSLASQGAAEPRSGSLADVLDVILDKGIVVDAFIRVSLVGIEILTIDARVVVASVDTYMHFAREAHRLELGGGKGSVKQGLAGVMGKLEEGGAHSMARGALKGAGEGLKEGLLPHRDEGRSEGGVVQRALGAIKEKAGGAIRETLSPGEGEDDGKERSSAEEGSAAGGSQSNGASTPQRRSRPRSTAQRSRPQAARGRRERPARDDASDSAKPERESSGPDPPPARSGGATPERPSGRRAAPATRRAPSRAPRG